MHVCGGRIDEDKLAALEANQALESATPRCQKHLHRIDAHYNPPIGRAVA